jgi:hypothetical protein
MAEFNIRISGEPEEVSIAVRRLLGLPVDIPISGNSETKKILPTISEMAGSWAEEPNTPPDAIQEAKRVDAKRQAQEDW